MPAPTAKQSVHDGFGYPSEWGDPAEGADSLELVSYTTQLVTDHKNVNASGETSWLQRVGLQEALVPRKIAMRLWRSEIHVHGNRYQPLHQPGIKSDELPRDSLHAALLDDALDPAMPEAWLVTLSRLRITNAAALRILGLRHDRREMELLADSVETSKRAAKSSNLAAFAAIAVAALSLIIGGLQAFGWSADTRVDVVGTVDVEAADAIDTPPASEPIPPPDEHESAQSPSDGK